MSVLRVSLRGTGVLYAGGAAAVALTLAQQLLTVGILGAAEYGRVAIVASSAAVTYLIADVRTWELATKRLARPLALRDSDAAAATVRGLGAVEITVGIVGAAALVLLADPIATGFFDDASLTSAIRISALVVPFRMAAMGVSSALLRMHDRFGWVALRGVIVSAVRLVLVVGAALLFGDVVGVAIALVAAEAFAAGSSWAFAKRAHSLSEMDGPLVGLGRSRPGPVPVRELASLWLSASLKALQLELFLPVAATQLTASDVGFLRLGLDVSDLITKSTTPLSLVLGPGIIRDFEVAGRRRGAVSVHSARRLLAFVVVPLALVGFALVPITLPHVVADGSRVVTPALILLVGTAASGLAIWVRPALVALGEVRAQNVLGAVFAVLMLLGTWLASSLHGLLGAAVTMAAFQVCYSFASMGLYRRALLRPPGP